MAMVAGGAVLLPLPVMLPVPRTGHGTHPQRLSALDATRGIAMGMVCLSHFIWAASLTSLVSHALWLTMTAMMVAAPAFVLLSGMTLGYVEATSPASYSAFASKLVERGIILLTVAHLLILPSRIFLAPHGAALRSVEMTDTIGVCILLGPRITRWLRGWQRVLLSGALVALTWAVIALVPDNIPLVWQIIEHALVGYRASTWWYSTFPLVPWFALYVLGTVIGNQLLPPYAGARNHNARVLLRWAARLVTCGVLLELAIVAAIAAFPGDDALVEWGQRLANPFGKFPPAPAYLLLLAGAGLTLAALVSVCVDRGIGRWFTDRAQEIGRASLFIFIVQGYLYYFIEVRWLHPLPWSWPLAFAGSLIAIGVIAKVWLRLGGNRLFTLPRTVRKRGPELAGDGCIESPTLDVPVEPVGKGRSR